MIQPMVMVHLLNMELVQTVNSPRWKLALMLTISNLVYYTKIQTSLLLKSIEMFLQLIPGLNQMFILLQHCIYLMVVNLFIKKQMDGRISSIL